MNELAYYNENDPYAASWLRNLIAAGYIAPGHVDERDIRDVRAGDLDGFTQCHFFAGIGVWSYALRLAGWPDTRPVWSASCPCQPLSSAGLHLGHVDERHLWPALHGLVAERGPAAVFGEQVASKDGREWFAAVRSDLEHLGYACGAADLAAAGVGAPHIRQRLFFVANARHDEPSRWDAGAEAGTRATRGHEARAEPSPHRAVGVVADASPSGFPTCEREIVSRPRRRRQGRAVEQRGGAPAGGLGDADAAGRGRSTERDERMQAGQSASRGPDAGRPGARPLRLGDPDGLGEDPIGGFFGRPRAERAGSAWSDVDWLPCRDGKARPVEPGTFPLAHGAPARVGRLRAYGNAIVGPLAAEFIGAVLELKAIGAPAMLEAAE